MKGIRAMNITRHSGIGATLLLLGVAACSALIRPDTAGAVEPVEARPVMVGDDNGYEDACSTLGRVAGLNPRGDNFLAVRAIPSTAGAMIAKLKPGHIVWMCDQTNDGAWHGVVFQPDDGGEGYADCGVSSPAPYGRYRGPCRSGWVSSRYIELLAG